MKAHLVSYLNVKLTWSNSGRTFHQTDRWSIVGIDGKISKLLIHSVVLKHECVYYSRVSHSSDQGFPLLLFRSVHHAETPSVTETVNRAPSETHFQSMSRVDLCLFELSINIAICLCVCVWPCICNPVGTIFQKYSTFRGFLDTSGDKRLVSMRRISLFGLDFGLGLRCALSLG